MSYHYKGDASALRYEGARYYNPTITQMQIGIWYNALDEAIFVMESHARSIAKAVSYRVLGSASTALIVYAGTRSFTFSAGAGAADAVIKIGLYFVHERLWNHIPFGREQAKTPEYEI
jgi:adenylylsulfate kinase